jgi:hypothetical protein
MSYLRGWIHAVQFSVKGKLRLKCRRRPSEWKLKSCLHLLTMTMTISSFVYQPSIKTTLWRETTIDSYPRGNDLISNQLSKHSTLQQNSESDGDVVCLFSSRHTRRLDATSATCPSIVHSNVRGSLNDDRRWMLVMRWSQTVADEMSHAQPARFSCWVLTSWCVACIQKVRGCVVLTKRSLAYSDNYQYNSGR